MADLKSGLSTYLATGLSDIATPIVDATDATKQDFWNGVFKSAVDLQGLLGNALDLKGTTSSLASRLSLMLAHDGTLVSGVVFPPTPLPNQPFYRTDLFELFVYSATEGKFIRANGQFFSSFDLISVSPFIDMQEIDQIPGDQLWRLRVQDARLDYGAVNFIGEFTPFMQVSRAGGVPTTFEIFNPSVRVSGNAFRGDILHVNTATRNYAFPDASGTVSLLENPQTWTAEQTFSLPIDAPFLQSGFGAVSRPLKDRLRSGRVSILDFGADPLGVLDSTAAIILAEAEAFASNRRLESPHGTFKITSPITIRVSMDCADANQTKFQAEGSFTAFKFFCSRKELNGLNVWFTPGVTAAAVAYQFGEGTTQFSRNIVNGMFARYASTSFFSNSDMWGNVFNQINADFSLRYGFNLTSTGGGTTNSFRNLYAINASTTGSMTAGLPTLTVVDAQNLSVGQPLVILGAGAAGPLIATITGVSGLVLTLSANAINTVTNSFVMCHGTGFASLNFSDTHFYDAYFDKYPSSANGLNGAVDIADAVFNADSVRFESCAITAPNTALLSLRSNVVKVGIVQSFETHIDSGGGTHGFMVRAGIGGDTTTEVGEIGVFGFKHFSGGLKKARISAVDRLILGGLNTSIEDCDDNGFDGCLFFGGREGRRINAAVPNTGTWCRGDEFRRRSPLVGGAQGGACLTSGTFGSLAGVTATSVAGKDVVTFSALSTLKREQFITIVGLAGVFKVVDISTLPTLTALVVPAPAATVSGAAVAYAVPTFGSLGLIS